MPFKYVIKWQKTNPEKVTVEAFHKYPHTEEEKHKPAFIIGKAQGGGLLAIRHTLEKAAQKYPIKRRGKTTYIFLNEGDETAYETAYRIGLAAAMINKAQTAQELQKTTHYILNATSEEIWFWTSKLLDDEINTKALDALAVLSGATQTSQKAPKRNRSSARSIQTQKETCWSILSQRVEEKAT
ncbi:MAG: hypothetical protein ACPLM9_01630 [Methanomassiliicoccales archaeon]|jgi:hypothetical protein